MEVTGTATVGAIPEGVLLDDVGCTADSEAGQAPEAKRRRKSSTWHPDMPQSLKDGPCTYEEIMDWPTRMLKHLIDGPHGCRLFARVCGRLNEGLAQSLISCCFCFIARFELALLWGLRLHAAQHFNAWMQYAKVLITHCSGYDTIGLVFRSLVASLRKDFQEPIRRQPIFEAHAADIKHSARRCLLSYKDGHRHVFANILDRVPVKFQRSTLLFCVASWTFACCIQDHEAVQYIV